MTSSPRIPPTPEQLVALVPPGGQLIGVVSFMEALEAANRIRAHGGKKPRYSLAVHSPAALTPTVAGFQLGDPGDLPDRVDTLVVGGRLSASEAPLPDDFCQTVHTLAARATRVIGICMGAFALGEVGLLDGRRCTTHWLALDRLATQFPRAKVQTDVLYTQDGPVWTSAGAAAGMDLALHLLRQDLGPKMALAVAQALVVFAHRPGGQSQFARPQTLQITADDRLQRLIARITTDPNGDHRVAELARSAGMSPRNFARRFREQTGKTPAAFVTTVRIDAAQRALSQGEQSVDTIASECGFGTAETLRRAFHKHVGVSPSVWRSRFGAVRG